MKKRNCLVCNSQKIKLKFSVSRNDLKEGLKYSIYECQKCGFSFAEGLFNSNLLENIYNDHFYSTTQQDDYYSSSPIILNVKDRSQMIEKFRKEGKLLDVGTGKGYFVEEVSKFMDAEGIDLSEYAVEEAKKSGRKVMYGNFLTHKFKEEFDIVTLWDVFSCFDEPAPVINRIYNILKTDGYLIFTLPMIDSTMSKIFRNRWPLMIPPTNMTYFTPKSVKELLENGGFKIIETQYQAKWISLDFVVKKLLKSFGLYNLASKKLPFPQKAKIRFRSRDILTVIAKKV